MLNLKNRLARIEQEQRGAGRLAVVRVDEDTSDDAVTAHLAGAGIDAFDPRTLVVRLKRLVRPEGSAPALKLLYAMDR